MKIYNLFKLQFDEKFDILKTGNIKKMLGAIFKYILLIAGLTLAFYVLFMKLSLIGFLTDVNLLSIVFLVTQVISLIFAVGHTIKNLFQSKDNELLMSLPASPNQVFVSKIILSYVQEVMINATFTLPLLLSVSFLGGSAYGFGLYFYLILPVLMLILPIFPLALALLLSIPVSMILKFFKKHIVLSIITIVAFIALFVLFYVKIVSGFAQGFNIASKQIETVRKINKAIASFASVNYLYLALAKGVMQVSKIYMPLLFLVLGLGVFAVAFLVVKPFFFKMAMGNLEHSVTKEKVGEFKKEPVLWSLIKKEFLTVFRSPGQIFDYFLFVILMPFIVVVFDNMLIDLVVNQAGRQMINGAHVIIVAVFATLSNIYSSSAISREGANFYIIKTMPINFYTQTLAKIIFNAMFSVGAIILTGIVTCFYMNVAVAILTTLISVFISLAHIFSCFDRDLKSPTLDWYDGGDISKVNKNTTKGIISGLLIALIAGGFIMLTASSNLGLWSFVILLVLCMIYCVYKAYILVLRVFYQYERLEP